MRTEKNYFCVNSVGSRSTTNSSCKVEKLFEASVSTCMNGCIEATKAEDAEDDAEGTGLCRRLVLQEDDTTCVATLSLVIS